MMRSPICLCMTLAPLYDRQRAASCRVVAQRFTASIAEQQFAKYTSGCRYDPCTASANLHEGLYDPEAGAVLL